MIDFDVINQDDPVDMAAYDNLTLPNGLPSGGTEGQILQKTSSADYDAEWTDPAPAGVVSVNGRTGDVTLTAEDVGALPDDTPIPTKTSDLTNDSGFLTQHQSLSGYATEQWVEGKGYLTEHQSLSAYRTSAEQDTIDQSKVDKVEGKGLSSNDYTTAEKTKLSELENYDDTALKDRVSAIEGKESAWDGKQDAISDLSTIRSQAQNAIPSSQKGTANGLAELDATGHVPSSQLPSYVDDVIEAATVSDFPAEGETGKIYVATQTNLSYRWAGSEYVVISPSLALGETSSTAYRGDRGKIAYDHSQGGTSTGHITSSERSDWNAKAPKASHAFTGTPTAPTAATGTNTTQVATTAFVNASVAAHDPSVAEIDAAASSMWGV